jgi:hypothetical protein
VREISNEIDSWQEPHARVLDPLRLEPRRGRFSDASNDSRGTPRDRESDTRSGGKRGGESAGVSLTGAVRSGCGAQIQEHGVAHGLCVTSMTPVNVSEGVNDGIDSGVVRPCRRGYPL